MARRSTIGLLITLAACAPAGLAVTACGAGGSAALPKTAGGKPATVGVADAGGLGRILVDSRGHTLYLFRKDAGSRSRCSGGCAEAWPPLRATGKPSAGTSLPAAKLGTTPRSDGRPQVTYNGHPLYLYAADLTAGDAKGQGLTAFGAPWYALSAAGTAVTRPGTNVNPGPGY